MNAHTILMSSLIFLKCFERRKTHRKGGGDYHTENACGSILLQVSFDRFFAS